MSLTLKLSDEELMALQARANQCRLTISSYVRRELGLLVDTDCPGCGLLFMAKDRRQKYCSSECAAQARWKRFAATRTRDYAAEYAARKRE